MKKTLILAALCAAAGLASAQQALEIKTTKAVVVTTKAGDASVDVNLTVKQSAAQDATVKINGNLSTLFGGAKKALYQEEPAAKKLLVADQGAKAVAPQVKLGFASNVLALTAAA